VTLFNVRFVLVSLLCASCLCIVIVYLCAVGTESVVVEISDSDQQSTDGTQTWPMRGHRRKPSRGPELPVLDQLPVSVLFDMRYVFISKSYFACSVIE